MKHRILVIDDDELPRQAVEALLLHNGFLVDSAASGRDGINRLRQDPHGYSLVVLDFHLPDGTGAEISSALRGLNPDIFVLILSGDTSREALKASWKAGAVEFLEKTVAPERLLGAIRSWCSKYEDTHRPVLASSEPDENERLISVVNMVGRSRALAEVVKKVLILRDSGRNVLVLGESGTGKELVARALHNGRGKFLPVNCASFRSSPSLLETALFGCVRGAYTGADRDKAGIFEEADGGTVFLDEIHHLSPDVQVSLLRALQEKTILRVGSSKEIPVRFRLLAAAKPDLSQEVDRGGFRLDLYYRIKGSSITIPPLRERIEDIGPLVAYYCRRWNGENDKTKAFLARTLQYLEAYPWPGNVRELENLVFDLLELTPEEKISPEHLEPKFFSPGAASSASDPSTTQLSLRERLDQVERSYLASVLKSSRSLREASRQVKVSPATLLRLARKHGLSKGSEPST